MATILNQSFKPETATFSIPDTFIDEEQNNRHIRIYGIQCMLDFCGFYSLLETTELLMNSFLLLFFVFFF